MRPRDSTLIQQRQTIFDGSEHEQRAVAAVQLILVVGEYLIHDVVNLVPPRSRLYIYVHGRWCIWHTLVERPMSWVYVRTLSPNHHGQYEPPI